MTIDLENRTAEILSPHVGVGFDVTSCGPSEVHNVLTGLREALARHGVVLVRGLKLDEDAYIELCQQLGELETTLKDYAVARSHSSILYVTNERSEGKYVGALPDGEMYFHADRCYRDRPIAVTSLYALSVPERGGETRFAHTGLAWRRLPEKLAARLHGLTAEHVYEPGSGANAICAYRRAPTPGAHRFVHPVVVEHPVSGEPSLFVNRLMTHCILELPKPESDALLDSLFEVVEDPAYIYEHSWRPGDFLLWDNFTTVHARRHFDDGQLRKLRRIAVRGSKPRAFVPRRND